MSERQIAIRANVVFKRDVASSERSVFQRLRIRDPIHSEVAEVIACRVPCHQIPDWRQDQHRLRFNFSAGSVAFRVPVLKPQEVPFKKRGLERGQQGRIHRPNV